MKSGKKDVAWIERVEIELLLEAIYRIYGYDFRRYAPASIRRRFLHRMQAEGVKSFSALQDLVLHDEHAMGRLLDDVSIPVTEMFRDPPFFQAVREIIVPYLRDVAGPIRIWHAGCATGEEAYSMSIILSEEGLAKRTQIYATDMNTSWLDPAKAGIFPLDKMQLYTQNYMRSGGLRPFSDYYTVIDGQARFDEALAHNIVFARHNLATDHTFNEFHLILCRNVFIYFTVGLQRRVLSLFRDSLTEGGIVALGSKEAILDREFWREVGDPAHRMYRYIG
jgi:chemotaxis protein methyltransferase CheR